MTSILKKKLNKKGFTLAELLVVVAIIAILVAIAIPVFNAAQNKAKLAVEQANARSAYAEAVTTYLSESDTNQAAIVAKGYAVVYDGITYTAKPNDAKAVKWTVTLSESKAGGTTTYQFGGAAGAIVT